MEQQIFTLYYPHGLMGLSIGIAQTVAQARDWAIMNNLTFPVLADSTTNVTSLFTIAPPWVAVIDDQ